MNSEKLRNIIETAREKKGISQREVAKISGISRSTFNDLINGKIKKVSVDDLIKIGQTLDISLEDLLEAADYKEVVNYFSMDRYEGVSTAKLKKKLDEYAQSEMNLLDFDAKKRKYTTEARKKLFFMSEKLKQVRDNKRKEIPIDEIITTLDETSELLSSVEKKYDYSKLPEKF